MKSGPVRNGAFRNRFEDVLANMVALEIDLDEIDIRLKQAVALSKRIHDDLSKIDNECHQVKWQIKLFQ